MLKMKKECFKIFWVFIIGSIIGCIVETIVCLIQKGHFEYRRGVVYGPFIPVYGFGAVMYYITVAKIKKQKLIFFVCMLVGGIVEYLFSYFQEKWFGTISWDYSQLAFNINGRTSLLHCLYWGTAGVIFVRYIYPVINQLDNYIDILNFRYLTGFLIAFMIFNITISCMAGNRQKERVNEIPAHGKIDIFLDKYYPDKRMDKIFSNKIVVCEKNKI